MQVLKQKDLTNWTRPLEDKTMNISKTLDQAADSLDQVKWKQVTKELIDLWVTFFKVMVTLAVLTYLIGKHLGHGIHRLNDWLATKWVQVLGLAGPTKLGRASPLTVEIVVVEVEPKLPPAPVIEDPWEAPIEVETMLPLALEPMAILFTAPLMIVAAQAHVALLAPAVQEQPPPSPRNRRRQSAQPAVTEAATTPTQRSRGRRAHQERKKNRQAA